MQQGYVSITKRQLQGTMDQLNAVHGTATCTLLHQFRR